MTSQSLTTDKRSDKRAGFMRLFGFQTKSFWTTILLFTIILFFVLPVFMLMAISDANVATDIARENLLKSTEDGWIEGIRYAVIPLMSIFGVVCACSRFKYLNNKVSVDFYHSLPVKRSRIYLTQLAVSAVALIIPYLFNFILTIVIMASNGIMSPFILSQIAILTMEVIAYTAIFGAITTLVGMISGLTAVQLTLSAVAVLLVPVIYFVSVLFIDIFSENMWFEYYTQASVFENMTPLMRFMLDSEPLWFGEVAAIVIAAALIYVGAYFVYTRRKSERAGTPVVFRPLAEVIKYILVYIGTLCGGLLFYFIMSESFAWTVFGVICGMVLTFMLTNTILNKTARAMFKGWKGLMIFGGVTAVCFAMLTVNAFGVNNYIPSEGTTGKVEVIFENQTVLFEFKDRDNVKALHKIYTEGDRFNPYLQPNGDTAYPINAFDNEELSMKIVFHPYVGVPVAKRVNIYNKNAFIEEFRTILDSEEFKTQYANSLRSSMGENGAYISIVMSDFTITSDNNIIDNNNQLSFSGRLHDLDDIASNNHLGLTLLEEAIKNSGFDHFQQSRFGIVYLNFYNSEIAGSVNIPLYPSMEKLRSYYIASSGTSLNMTKEECNKALAEHIHTIKIKDIVSGSAMFITDKDKIVEILSTSVGSQNSPFTFTDSRYQIEYSLSVVSGIPTKTIDENGKVVSTDTAAAYMRNMYQYFLIDKIPEFVNEYFN